MYQITIKRSAERELRRIDRAMIPKIVQAIQGLGAEPRPSGCRKLAGSDHHYRIRVGDYRVIYSVNDNAQLVDVIRIRHRSNAYE